MVSNWTSRLLTLLSLLLLLLVTRSFQPIHKEAFIGEIGLTGEIRRVTRIEQRINEAAKLGFTKIYAPKNSLHGMKIPEGIQVVGVTTVGEVLKKVFS